MDSTFKHKIYYVFNGDTIYIAGSPSTYMSGTSVNWVPPLDLAVKNTTGTSISFWFNLVTYTSDGTQVGTVSPQITLTIPSSVKPSCTIAVTDANGLEDQYGNPIKGLSELAVTITPTISYGADIVAYKTTVDGVSYTAASFFTSLLKSSGTLRIFTAVTDKRGRSGSASSTKTVLDYTAPAVQHLSVKRCNSDGTENMQGAYIMATFGGTVTALNNKNSATYILRYKKTSESAYTSVSFSALSGSYMVTDQTYIFAADTGSAYDVEIAISDNFNTSTRKTSASTAFAIMHFNASGEGVAIGKISEKNAIEFGLEAYDNYGCRINNGLAVYGSGTINANTTTDELVLSKINTPTTAFWYIKTFFHETKSDNRAQLAIPYTGSGSIYHRLYSGGAWTSWQKILSTSDGVVPLTNGGTGATSAAGALANLGIAWGTWTPIVTFGSTNATSFVLKNGYYSKIGNMVTLSFRIRCTAPATGEIAISGFASTCGSATAGCGGGGIFLPVYPYSSTCTGFVGFQVRGSDSIAPLVMAGVETTGAYSATGKGVDGASVYLQGTVAYYCV